MRSSLILVKLFLIKFYSLAQVDYNCFASLSFPFVAHEDELTALYIYTNQNVGLPDSISVNYSYKKKLPNKKISGKKRYKHFTNSFFDYNEIKNFYEIRIGETELPDSSLIIADIELFYGNDNFVRTDSFITDGFSPDNIIPIRFGADLPENNYDIVLVPDERLMVKGGDENDYNALRMYHSHNVVRRILLADSIIFNYRDEFNFYISKLTGKTIPLDSFYTVGKSHIVPEAIELAPELMYIVHRDGNFRDYYYNKTASTDDFSDFTIVHEFSHAFFFLQDEYHHSRYNCAIHDMPNVFEDSLYAAKYIDSIGIRDFNIFSVEQYIGHRDNKIYNEYYKCCSANCYMNSRVKKGYNVFGEICKYNIKTVLEKPVEFKMNK